MRKDLVAMVLHVQTVLEELLESIKGDYTLGTCPKCHSCDLDTQYHVGGEESCDCDWDSEEEHLGYHCRICGYDWAEATKDA